MILRVIFKVSYIENVSKQPPKHRFNKLVNSNMDNARTRNYTSCSKSLMRQRQFEEGNTVTFLSYVDKLHSQDELNELNP